MFRILKSILNNKNNEKEIVISLSTKIEKKKTKYYIIHGFIRQIIMDLILYRLLLEV